MKRDLDKTRIRNFSIIAHVDHGKSTLADRMLLATRTVSKREFQDQLLDDMELERERGITIKSRAVQMDYVHEGQAYQFNLIDTPGHVDFSYEVSRALAACEGALLLIDAAEGIGAQTVANTYLALENDLEIVPVLNKVDLPVARPEEVAMEMEHILGLPAEEALQISAKTGQGLEALMQAIISRIPAPKGQRSKPLRALIFDAVYDEFRGVIVYTRLMDGAIRVGDRIEMAGTRQRFEVLEAGVFKPGMTPTGVLLAGETGYVIANIKGLRDVAIGDTIRGAGSEVAPLAGYHEPQPMVYCGLYPSRPNDYENLRKALNKLHLNDCSFVYEPETSGALGFGFRCGFLGLLHMEIVQERLERESGLDMVQTSPNVTYEVLTTAGENLRIESPAQLPTENEIREIREPVAQVHIITPSKHMGAVMKLAVERYGTLTNTEYLSPERVMLTLEIPLAEIIFDFYDKLKSITRGFGTMDYEIKEYKSAPLVKLRILVNGIEVDALSTIVRREQAQRFGRKLIVRLRSEIPRHLFEIPLQAAIGNKPVARENIRAMRKNVTAKCYGGDITRKRKLLEKQKAGKKRMKSVGSVEIPQTAFMSVLKIERD